MPLTIVGISGHFHDAACCLMQDGVVVAAAEEERFSRRKHDGAIPRAAFRWCLESAGLTIADVDCVAYYEEPVAKLGRQLWMGLPSLPSTSAAALFRLDATRPEREIRHVLGYDGRLVFSSHHLSHAASSYLLSGFPEAAILTVDAVGEWSTTTYGRGSGAEMDLFDEVRFPHSLGLLYSAITAYLGFEVNEAEYKVMGLAPYGQPRFMDEIRRLITVEEAGGFRLDQKYFDFLGGERMFSPALCELFGRDARQPESEIDGFAQDVAASLQAVLEEILLEKVVWLHDRVPSDHLCLAGGVALNCVAVGKIVARGPFEHVFVQPAAGDAGGALGAAAVAHVQLTGRRPAPLHDMFLGPGFEAEADGLLRGSGVRFEDFAGREPDLLAATASRLARGEVVAWFQGRMEFGPRALGNRSILADPRQPAMRDRINAQVKRREAFRPFAPAVLAERASEHFHLGRPAPFMVETVTVRHPAELPAVTHVDGSARVQTVSPEDNRRFHGLLSAFEATTGCPVLLNTSFNLRGEPIVCTPLDALLCFVRTDLDCLVLGDVLVERSALPSSWLEWFRDRPPPTPRTAHEVYALL
ncbi:MAG TPA: carbamoyltransferase C-terminal domain-containing protein [Acidimicrobiales bacterium]|nr:carbamoyltransferase C-terminal domain-containing protein [Acidimicrobiales bacterium]